MPETHDVDKTISNPAKLLRGYMLATGKTDAKQIAEDLNIPLRTIQRLKLECAISGVSEDANSAKDAISGVSDRIESANSAIYGVFDQQALACADKTTRATNELPTEVLIPKIIDYPLAPKVETPKRLRSQGSRLPADWSLPDDWKAWAQVNCFASDDRIAIEAANFADYWIAKPSQATSLDWKRTWQKWARKAFSQIGNSRPQHTGSYGRQPEKQQIESLSATMARLQAEGAFQ